MNKREIRRFLTALDVGTATKEQVATANRERADITTWLELPEGRAFLFGQTAATVLIEAREDWVEHAEAYASAFASECGGLPEGKEMLLVRFLMDFAYRGFSAIAAPTAASRREAGVLFAEEGREKRAAKTGREVAERREWVWKRYSDIRRSHRPGARGDKSARVEVARQFFKAFGWLDRAKGKRLLSDATIKRYLQKTRENMGSSRRK
jgi:hypothetical protein